MKLIVGLGNVGKRYAHTRHNIGFMVAGELLRQFQSAPAGVANSEIYGLKISDWSSNIKLQAEIAKVELPDNTVTLAKPQTMMNLSGESIQRLMQFYKIAPANVWVIFDDVDVPFGRLRLRTTGGSGGHQGLDSTIAHIGPNFVRVRVGISLNDRSTEPSEIYVLRPFNPEEQTHLPQVITAAAKVIQAQIQLESPEDSTFDLLPKIAT